MDIRKNSARFQTLNQDDDAALIDTSAIYPPRDSDEANPSARMTSLCSTAIAKAYLVATRDERSFPNIPGLSSLVPFFWLMRA